MSSQRIIVGVDGSSGARTALDWAVDECRLRACALVVVHAVDGRDIGSSDYAADGYSEPADQLLSGHASAASARRPSVPVTTVLSRERAADSLVDLSVGAQLVVVGARGHNAFTSSMLGSVSHRTAAHALCAVAIIPRTLPTFAAGNGPRAVVIASSPEPAGRLALEFARQEAELRGTSLLIVPPDGQPVESLLRAARGAHLLVLGCEHSDNRWGTRLGPVPTAILPRSPCPVVVVGGPTRSSTLSQAVPAESRT